MAKVAVLIIHGMGSQRPDFAEETITEINKRISDAGHDPDDIAWEPVFWADILDPMQQRYFRNANRSGDLDFKGLRKFIITALGDAGAYQKVSSVANSTYERIHERIDDAMEKLYTDQLNSRPIPLIVMAHSLGCHIISNYIWDMQNEKRTDLSPFQRMEKLAGMITFGCNIPLFTFAYDNVQPIKFPGKGLNADQKAKAKWLNFYDPDDVLGYPLKPINAAYRATVDKDIAINTGGFLTSWNPMAHNGYWTDNDFTKPVTKYINLFT